MSLTKISNNALSDITALPAGLPTGALTLLSTQTASSSASISFTSGIDSTYDSYIFKFINIHPATDSADFSFQADTGTNTNYNQTMTTTTFRAFHNESDTNTSLAYIAGEDQAQGTGFQKIANDLGNDNDQSTSGMLQIFKPSSDTFVKHFISRFAVYKDSDFIRDEYCAGYINTTTALTRVQFKMSTGNIDDGIIKLYGVS